MSTHTDPSRTPAVRERRLEFRHHAALHDAIEEIALDELGLDVYPNQIEVISTEQMLDAYSSIGMPLFYKHWSFGKHFARNEAMYRAGMQGPGLRDRHQFEPRASATSWRKTPPRCRRW